MIFKALIIGIIVRMDIQHPFSIGECGMPMDTSQCPQCGSPVGGQHHQAVSGIRPARDLVQNLMKFKYELSSGFLLSRHEALLSEMVPLDWW